METEKFEMRKLNRAKSMDDEVALLKMFPTEIWLDLCHSVLHNLELTTKISDSSPYFKKLLHPLRTKFLFPEVLKCVRRCLPRKKEEHKILQNSRQVCLIWYKTVKRLLREKMLCHYRSDSEINGLGSMFLGDYCCIEFTSEQEVNSFYQHFQASHLDKSCNPFPAHFLYIVYHAAESPPEYFQVLRQLLRRCGYHIQGFAVNVMNFEADMNLLEVKHFLDFLPNLKFLNILPHFHDITVPRNSTVLPFPTNENLDFIRVDGYCSGHVVDALLRHNRHVKSLWNIDEGLWEQRNHWLYSEPMPNLGDLAVIFPSPEELKLLNSTSVNWPLFSQGFIDTKEMQQCFDVMEQKFADTLTELFLDIVLLSDAELAHALRLNLPRLSLVGLTLLRPIALDLILPLKSSLTNLRIDVLTAEICAQEKAILFFSVANHILASNIWQLFPKLQQVAYPINKVTDTAKIYKRTQLPNKPLAPLRTQRNHTSTDIRYNGWSGLTGALAALHIDHYSGYVLAWLLCIFGGIACGILGHILL